MHTTWNWVAMIGTLMLALVPVASGERQNDARDMLVGDWLGRSICTNLVPACHDEEVVYHIVKSSDDVSKVILTADKIVNGKPEQMGVLEFKYDPQNWTLVNHFDNGKFKGSWEFKVQRDAIEGVLVLMPGKKIARNIKVMKGH
jgi:hypothetical protein